MEGECSNRFSAYFETLPETAKKKYVEKLTALGGRPSDGQLHAVVSHLHAILLTAFMLAYRSLLLLRSA